MALCGQIAALAACGAETLCTTTGFTPSPRPRVVLKGQLGDLPAALSERLAGVEMSLRALSVDGVEVARGRALLDAPFELAMPEGEDHFNLRLLVEGGSVLLKTLIPEARVGSEIHVGVLGADITAHALLAERSAEIERGVLSSMPPQVLTKVLGNAASSTDQDVRAFRGMVRELLDQARVDDESAGFDPLGSEVDETLLGRAGVDAEAYRRLRDRAAGAISVPVICDPARLRVLFTCDISGQALDGNGVPQLIRQQPKAGTVFLGITVDPSSPVADIEGALPRRLTPNDPDLEMYDDGTHGDEQAGDQVYSRIVDLPRGIRVIYKYTDGSAGEGFTGTEEWPGNARILQVDDLLTGLDSGAPDCVVVRRDSFGDEASNKNFVNLNGLVAGGALDFDVDLGGSEAQAIDGVEGRWRGGLSLGQLHSLPPLTPAGVPEARENGICAPCPAPLTVSADDREPPRLVAAAWTASDRLRVSFSEDLDLASASRLDNYALFDAEGGAWPLISAGVRGSVVTLQTATADPVQVYALQVQDIADASVDRNRIEGSPRVEVGPDRTPPQLVDLRSSTLTELNPAARPPDPALGQLLVLRFDELLDRISAQNVANYRIEGADGRPLQVLAAYQRGREVLLVTADQGRGSAYRLWVEGPFDRAGNMMAPVQLDFVGLALYRVDFFAVPGFAYLSEDGRQRGLPAGDQLYLTGTVLAWARALDGRDLRVRGRSDVAGLDGFALAAGEQRYQGQAVHGLSLLLPPGSYAYKFAHGRPRDAIDPPATLEAVSKSLSTTNDDTGVAVNPVSGIGRDGVSYQGARLSLLGNDSPGPGVLFKRENPDQRFVVEGQDLSLPVLLIGAWRDRPFGRGQDYDDGRVELPLFVVDAPDQQGPRLLDVAAPCSAGVLLSFDEKLGSGAADLGVELREIGAAALNARVQYVGSPLRSTQVFVQTAEQFAGASYQIDIAGVADALGNVSEPQGAVFAAPGVASACEVVDQSPPEVVELRAERPDRLRVIFSERVHSRSVVAANFAIEHRQGGAALTVDQALRSGGGTEVVLRTSTQEIEAPYRLRVSNIDDEAQPANTLVEQTLDFDGFGDRQAPQFAAQVVTPGLIWLRADEPLDPDSAQRIDAYQVSGVQMLAVEFSASATLRASASAGEVAPIAEDQVLLRTSDMQPGQTYSLQIDGVRDLSGNAAQQQIDIEAPAGEPHVDVLIEYLVSRTATVFGAGPGGSSGVPGRALSPDVVQREREGLFVRGAGLRDDGAGELAAHPATQILGGFPARGPAGLADFAGADPQLRDDATGGDRVAGDGVYSILIPDVPLGSVIAYKAFASYSTAYRDSSGDPRALVADADPGPSQYDDGEEYPGNDNGVRILADSDGDGRVVIHNLFGDEVTYKRREDQPVFVWVDDVSQRTP